MSKVLLLDFDGVLTDGTKIYDLDGKVMAKAVNDRDRLAVIQLMREGWRIIVVSGDARCNKGVIEDLGAEFVYARGGDKLSIVSEMPIDKTQTYFIADDIRDVPVMKMLSKPHSFCPKDCVPSVKKFAKIINCLSGKGVVSWWRDQYAGKL